MAYGKLPYNLSPMLSVAPAGARACGGAVLKQLLLVLDTTSSYGVK